jgi:hypothetical protein
VSTNSAETALAVVLRIVNMAEPLGTRTTVMGARLVGHAPHVAPEAYLHVIFPPLNEADLDALEAEVGRPLPIDYRAVLRLANGLSLFSGSLSIYGRRTSSARTGDAARQPFSATTPNKFERPRGLTEDAVVVGGYSDDGSLVYVGATGEVCRCSRDSASPLNRWRDLPAMLTHESNRLATCFDETGRLRDGGRGPAPPPDAGSESRVRAI